MKAIKRAIAAVELLLIVPAVLFMTALFVRNLQPSQYEPAHSALLLVEWFSARRLLGLDIFLVAMPLAALIIGCAVLLRDWRGDADLRQASKQVLSAVHAHLATLLIALATLMAGGILAIVAVHVATG